MRSRPRYTFTWRATGRRLHVSMVAQRQGHGPQVLLKHYSKAHRSSDRKAAEHLCRLVHKGVGEDTTDRGADQMGGVVGV